MEPLFNRLFLVFSLGCQDPREGTWQWWYQGWPLTHLLHGEGSPFTEALADVFLHLLLGLGLWTSHELKGKGSHESLLSQVHGTQSQAHRCWVIDQHCSPQTLLLVTMCALTSQYENATVTIKRHHRYSGLESSNLFSHNSGGLKSEIKVSGFPRSLSPGLVAGHPLLYLLASSMFFPLYTSVFLIFLSIRCQSYWIRAAHITSF